MSGSDRRNNTGVFVSNLLKRVCCCRSDKDLVNQERSLSLSMHRDDSKSAGSRNREVRNVNMQLPQRTTCMRAVQFVFSPHKRNICPVISCITHVHLYRVFLSCCCGYLVAGEPPRPQKESPNVPDALRLPDPL